MNRYLVFLIMVLALGLTSCSSDVDDTESTIILPDGYSLEKYTIAKQLDTSCKTHSDCTTPVDYLIRSNCPYTSVCLDDKCVVICPSYS